MPVAGANRWHDFPQSSNVRAAYYDDDAAQLFLMLGPDGRAPVKYRYDAVPAEVFDGLLNAGSKGQYHHRMIKWAFAYSRLG